MNITKGERERILWRRLSAQHLDRRYPRSSLKEVVGACGVQNTPPGSASISLIARIDGISPDEVRHQLEDDRMLVQAWSLRAAPHIFPVDDYHTFTQGLLPWEETFLRHFIKGAVDSLDKVELSVTELTEIMFPAVTEVLDGIGLNKARLAGEVADLMCSRISSNLHNLWNAPGPFGRFGETLVGYGLYIGSLAGAVCHGPRKGTSALLVRPDQWLDPLAPSDPLKARMDLVRKYLHCYGPSTPASMAAWSGLHPQQVSEMWKCISEEVMQVSLGGRGMWLLASDREELERPPVPEDARLLPPHDPYMQSRDRELLLPDTSLHHHVWRMAGGPGTVLFEGEVVGTWRSQKRGGRISLSVMPFRHLSPSAIEGIDEEAVRMAGQMELDLAAVKVSPPLRP